MSYPQIPLLDCDSFIWAACCAAKEDEPVENVKHTLKLKMQSIIDKFDRGLSYHAYLTSTDKSNFRYALAKIKPYKGNRTQPKPQYFEEAREYLVKYWNAEVIYGMEADDAIGIVQYSDKSRNTCIVSIDKDMLTVPGFYLNWRTGAYGYTSLLEADRNFWKQMITGDTTDNIQGVQKWGKVKADKLLAECATSEEMRQAVIDVYKSAPEEGWNGLTAEEAFKEMGHLLFIRRKPNEGWDDRWE
jgi:5'-3' exonuclease